MRSSPVGTSLCSGGAQVDLLAISRCRANTTGSTASGGARGPGGPGAPEELPAAREEVAVAAEELLAAGNSRAAVAAEELLAAGNSRAAVAAEELLAAGNSRAAVAAEELLAAGSSASSDSRAPREAPDCWSRGERGGSAFRGRESAAVRRRFATGSLGGAGRSWPKSCSDASLAEVFGSSVDFGKTRAGGAFPADPSILSLFPSTEDQVSNRSTCSFLRPYKRCSAALLGGPSCFLEFVQGGLPFGALLTRDNPFGALLYPESI